MNSMTALRVNEVASLPETIVGLTADDVRRSRETFPLALFWAAAERVPAYKDFLRRNRISPERIRTADDLSSVPPIDKKNYISQYPLEQLCWDGTFSGKMLTYTATSGSTGAPFYFPRDASLDHRAAIMHELFFRSVSKVNAPTTLVIVSFGMGIWIGGTITYQAFRNLKERGLPVSIITPGVQKKEIFEALSKLAPKYDQVILCGYPPFIKDILDEAHERGIDAASMRLKLLFAAETYSETFRDYVHAKIGATEPLRGSANIYGSAELGAMAIETPLAIALRRRALQEPSLYAALFSEVNKLPTLAQFHPSIVNFEEQDGELLLTGDNAVPLVRYAIGDRGGVHAFDDLKETISSSPLGVDVIEPLPFVYVYERADFSASLYGILIHAEYVRSGLQSHDVENMVTGKFSMSTERDEQEDQFLDVHVELKPGLVPDDDLRKRVRSAIVRALLERSSEYRALHGGLGERVVPHVALWPYEHPTHFRPGSKQKWIKKG